MRAESEHDGSGVDSDLSYVTSALQTQHKLYLSLRASQEEGSETGS